MATEPIQFPYRAEGVARTSNLPFLPLGLHFGNRSIEVTALLDSGASVNVLPYSLGLELGVNWEGPDLALGGNLSAAPAKGIFLTAIVGSFSPVRLVFAWTKLDTTPVILGQTNFFQAFNVSFVGAEKTFHISPYTPSK